MIGTLRIPTKCADPAVRRAHRAAYCAACHALRDHAGRTTTLTTSRELTVLMAVAAGVHQDGVGWRDCTAFPWRQVAVSRLPDDVRELVAQLHVAAVEAKLIDDVQDDGGLLRRGLLWIWQGRGRAARQRLAETGFPTSLLEGLPSWQARAETEGRTLEEFEAPFVALTSQAFAWAAATLGRLELVDTFERLGAALGSIVYMLDAWRDRERDQRSGAFNAWIAAGRDDGVSAAERIRARVDVARALVDGLPLAEAEAGVLAATFDAIAKEADGMRTKESVRAIDRRQAGDCDCGGGDCCTGGDCCSGGDGCYCSCDCCWLDRERRESRRSARRGSDVGVVSDGSVDVVELADLAGAEGVALEDMARTGRVKVGGLVFDALLDEGVAPKGARVRLVEQRRNGRWLVERAD